MARGSGWGARVTGVGSTIAALDAVEDDWSSDAVWAVGTPVEYGPYQEFGTSKMAAQPHLRPAVAQARREIPGIAEGATTMDELLKLVAFHIERGTKQRAPVDTGNLRASYAAERIQ